MAQLRVHAFTDDALGEHDAVGLVGELRAGRVSRRELVEAAIARTRAVDPRLCGLACDRFDDAVEEASSDHDGFFAGVPSLVKDNSDYAGLPTQQGTRAYVGRPVKAHGDFARMFTTIGTTVLGKSRLSEFGFSPSAEFRDDVPVRNPWHPDHTSGASSAGSAALVAAGAVPIAHANDGGGSIRIPAACCGLVGLKATRGRIPSDKLTREQPVRIVHDGVVTRSVRDTAAFVRESERVYRDLTLPPVGDVTGPAATRLRVALMVDSIGGRVTHDETRATLADTARLLEDLGHHVEEVPVPDVGSFADDFLLYWATLALYLSRAGRFAFNSSFDRARTDNLTKGLARHAARHAWRLPAAITRLRRSHQISKPVFDHHDVLLTPVMTLPTPEIGWLDPRQSYETVIGRILEWVAVTPLQNASGEPAISLPMGTSSAGLPIGVQLAAPRGYDRRLLELAFELEQARPFPRIQHPAARM